MFKLASERNFANQRSQECTNFFNFIPWKSKNPYTFRQFLQKVSDFLHFQGVQQITKVKIRAFFRKISSCFSWRATLWLTHLKTKENSNFCNTRKHRLMAFFTFIETVTWRFETLIRRGTKINKNSNQNSLFLFEFQKKFRLYALLGHFSCGFKIRSSENFF